MLVLHNKDKVKTVQDADALVSAERPNPKLHPLCFETVSNCLMHGPCGNSFPLAPCMKDGKCSKNFPKEIRSETVFAEKKLE